MSAQRVIGVFLLFSFLTTSCATFQPKPFPIYDLDDHPYQKNEGGMELAIGSFTPEEIKTYFASDLVKKNVWPVRMMLINESERSYLFSKGMIEPPAASSLVAARRGRRSAGHRLFWGYVLCVSFFGLPLGIPLVVTGFQAMDANSYMESTYKRNEIEDGEVKPGKTIRGILYFHRPDLPETIDVILLDSKTDEKLKLSVNLHKTQLPAIQSDAMTRIELP